MPYDANGKYTPQRNIDHEFGLAEMLMGTRAVGPLDGFVLGLGGGARGSSAKRMTQGNQDYEQGVMRGAFDASSPLLAAEALSRGSPEQRKLALSLMLQEKDPVKRLERELKQLEINEKKAAIAEDAKWLAPRQPQSQAAPQPALPNAMPPAATPPSIPGTSVAPPTPSPVVTGSVPSPAASPTPAAPAPKRPQTQAELIEFIQATRTQEEIKAWRELRRTDKKEALKVLEGWLEPNKEQEKSRMKEAGEGQGKAQAALPGIVSTTDSLLKKIDDVLYEPDPKNPGKYLPDPKKPGQFIPNQTLPQVVGSFDGHSWVPTLRSSSVDMQERLKQVRGGAFLQAFESLRGAGSITEKEAEPATAALARLDNLRQSEAGYTEALNDFRKEVLRLRQLAFDRASGKLPMPSQEPPSPQAAGGPPGPVKPDPLGIR
jgi:hypothetical protein